MRFGTIAQLPPESLTSASSLLKSLVRVDDVPATRVPRNHWVDRQLFPSGRISTSTVEIINRNSSIVLRTGKNEFRTSAVGRLILGVLGDGWLMCMQAHASPDCPLHLRKALMRWTITLPYVMRTHLLDYEPGVDALEELLTNDEVAWLRRPVDGLWAHQPMRAAGEWPHSDSRTDREIQIVQDYFLGLTSRNR